MQKKTIALTILCIITLGISLSLHTTESIKSSSPFLQLKNQCKKYWQSISKIVLQKKCLCTIGLAGLGSMSIILCYCLLKLPRPGNKLSNPYALSINPQNICDINQATQNLATALGQNDTTGLIQAIKQGATIKSYVYEEKTDDENNNTITTFYPLIMCATNPEHIKYLISNYKGPLSEIVEQYNEEKDYIRLLPLQYFIQENLLDCAKVLVEYGNADVNATGSDEAPIFKTLNKYPQFFVFLVAHGATLDVQDMENNPISTYTLDSQFVDNVIQEAKKYPEYEDIIQNWINIINVHE